MDRLISKIRDIQRPCMNGERSADVALVSQRLRPSFGAVKLTLHVGRTWPYSARIRKEMAEISPGQPFGDDVVAGSNCDS